MSVELEKLFQFAEKAHNRGYKVAVATVLSIRGSAYRRPGARMFIAENGESAGMIGGGCFDADVKEAARHVLATGQPELRLYDMSNSDPWGLNVGCDGQVYILIESLDAPNGWEWYYRVKKALQNEERITVFHILSAKMDFDRSKAGGPVQVFRTYSAWEEDSQGPETMAHGEQLFMETIVPSPRLFVIGAGNDAVSVVELASQAGFRVVVVDPNPHLLSSARFPRAFQRIHAREEQLADKLQPRPGDFVLFMSHRLHYDAACFRFFRQHPMAYYGFLGPRRRFERLVYECLGLCEKDLDRIRQSLYAPVGLDVGAETAEEVAVSIVAELLVVKNRRKPNFLRYKNGTIHEIGKTTLQGGLKNEKRFENSVCCAHRV